VVIRDWEGRKEGTMKKEQQILSYS
jgi:hypothetical protein